MRTILCNVITFSVVALLSQSCLSYMYFPLYETVELKGQPDGTQYQLLGNGKVIQSGQTPESLYLRKQRGLVIRFSKEGYYPQSQLLTLERSEWRGWLSMVISIPTVFIGWFIDLDSGAQETFSQSELTPALKAKP
ncbi:MAG: hypothetical protein KDK39_10310 [Leptospiraceae bacterium]|nr:hypothetical protein [Leptospiraceae bacterium]